MKLPEIKEAQKYVGLYVVDFGDHTGVGFTTEEVAELLDSEKFRDITVYKIHNAYPDGRMELKGVRHELFQLEAGIFFYAPDENTARKDYKRLTDIAITDAPPSRAKVHLARYDEKTPVTALIYPAEYDDLFSRWLLDNDYRTAGQTEGGIDAVQRYYDRSPEILKRQQLFTKSAQDSLTAEELLQATKKAIIR